MKFILSLLLCLCFGLPAQATASQPRELTATVFPIWILLKELAQDAWQPEYLKDEAKSSEEEIMIQGMMDCYFMENGQWILVDYKTDWELDEQRLEGYRLQLKLYVKALEMASGIPVREKILYDVRRGKEILC